MLVRQFMLVVEQTTSKGFRRSFTNNSARMASFYDFSVKTLKGETKSMSDYKGKIVLIENTATL